MAVPKFAERPRPPGKNQRLLTAMYAHHNIAKCSTSLTLRIARGSRRQVLPRLRCPIVYGLLPDNDEALERWSRMFGVRAGNPFAILAHVCADERVRRLNPQYMSPGHRSSSQPRQRGSAPTSDGDMTDRRGLNDGVTTSPGTEVRGRDVERSR